ncbi:MAG: NUDIX domain-containing protein [Litorilinea sp.]
MIIWDDHVLLVRRGVDPEKGKWALPGGYMDAHEMPDVALARELQEEVGIAVEAVRLIEIFPMAGPSQRNRGIVLVYTAEPASRTLEELWGRDDVWEAAWFRAGALPEDLAFESTITLLRQWQQRVCI